MSGSVVVPERAPRTFPKGMFLKVRRLNRFLWRLIVSPIRLFLAVRRSMTGASVTLLVIGIVTLNIIWGYPWVGMFSACFSLLVVGWTVNRIMRPNLSFNFTLPRSAPAGQPISVVLHTRNEGRLPAMDLKISYAPKARHRRRGRAPRRLEAHHRVLSPPNSLDMIEPGERIDLPSTIAFDQRGIHRLPNVTVISYFPFQLFRSIRHYVSQTQIAITPRPLTGDEDAVARELLDAFGGWSHKLLSGDALDYTGSREYQVGMPVRRWDFASWARLGRPIVREFQSPTVQLVTLIIDTSHDRSARWSQESESRCLERVLSLAATAVISLTQRLVRVRLCLTSEETQGRAATLPTLTPSDCESMLIRLAAAEVVDSGVADARIVEVMELLGRSPTMILTTRSEVSLPHGLPSGVSVLRVDAAHGDAGHRDAGHRDAAHRDAVIQVKPPGVLAPET